MYVFYDVVFNETQRKQTLAALCIYNMFYNSSVPKVNEHMCK